MAQFFIDTVDVRVSDPSANVYGLGDPKAPPPTRRWCHGPVILDAGHPRQAAGDEMVPVVSEMRGPPFELLMALRTWPNLR